MIKKLVCLALLFISFEGISQENKTKDTIKELNFTFPLIGQIIDHSYKTPLKSAHLFNLNSVVGTVTNDDGKFEIPTR